MAGKEIRLGDLLKIEDFDPMSVDVSYIQGVSNMVPKSGYIGLSEAEKLATVFLRCADYCSELLSQAIRLQGYREAEKKSQKGGSIERKVAGGTAQTTARESYSNDPLFVKASESLADADAFLSWVKQKHDNLIRAHVLCKDILKTHSTGQKHAGWEGVEDDFTIGEKSKKPEIISDNLGDFDINLSNDGQDYPNIS